MVDLLVGSQGSQEQQQQQQHYIGSLTSRRSGREIKYQQKWQYVGLSAVLMRPRS